MWFMRRAKPVSTNQRDVNDDEPDEADEHQEVKGMGRLPTPEEPWCRRENGFTSADDIAMPHNCLTASNE